VFQLSDGDVTKAAVVMKMKAELAYKFLYNIRVKILNNNIAVLPDD
jgi:hypothetical protein